MNGLPADSPPAEEPPLDELLSGQVASYRRRAAEYDEWFFRPTTS